VPETVLHLIDTPGPGGAETVLLEVVAGTLARGWNSLAGVPRGSWVDGALTKRNLPTVHIDSAGAFDARYLASLARVIRRHRVRLVHAHLITPSLYGAVAGRLLGVPSIATIHGENEVWAETGWRRIKLRLIDRASFAVVFVSSELRRRVLEANAFSARRAVVVHNGVRLDDFQGPRENGLRRAWGIADDDVLVGAIGNVRPPKGYEVLVRAAALARQSLPRLRFIVAGEAEGSLAAELRQLVLELGLEDAMQFVGFQDDVARVFANLDVFVLSSHAESFSLVAVQAMAAGVPIVATRSGGPQEVLGEESAVLVPPGSPEQLAAGLQRLITDPSLSARLTAHARARATQHFSVERMTGDYEMLYRSALGK
jgi:glycosyltransferase involved in cell wall biosynthesis